MNLNKPSLDDVLYEFALSKSTPDAELLDQFARSYPEHAAAITDFAVNLVLEIGYGNTIEADNAKVTPAVSRAMSSFQNRLFAAKRARETPPSAAVPPASAPNLYGSPRRRKT